MRGHYKNSVGGSLKKTSRAISAAIVIVVIVIVFVVFINPQKSLTFFTKRIVTGMTLSFEINRMNKTKCALGWYELDYVTNNLLIMHNHMYVVVMKNHDSKWRVIALINPSWFYHFRLQGSTVSSVKVDESARYVAIHYVGIDDTKEPLYIFDLERSKLKQYPHGEFPVGITFSNAKNRISQKNIAKELRISPEPKTCIYQLDESTIVYMYSCYAGNNVMVDENIYGAWGICFVNIETDEVLEIMIK